nr:12692_t:CDS:2 [Entrophospora candida]CAG8529008.1 14380_t:CDS:2 [Entrophospora candida]
MSWAYLSKRAQARTDKVQLLKEGFLQAQSKPHHKTENSNGIINLGLAENQLMVEELLQKLPGLFDLETRHLQNCHNTGSQELRAHVAKLINRYFNVQTEILPQHVTVHTGVTSAINDLAYVLCDEGDGILIPTPYYGAIDDDLYLKVHARAIPVHIGTDADIFDEQIHVERLEHAYQKSTNDDSINVRALLVTNPHNPLGQCYPRSVIEALLKFASSHKLHVIFDEIFALSVFDHVLESRPPVSASSRTPLPRTKQPFVSVLSLDNLDELIDPAFAHVIYGLSKDFCLKGFRVGFSISPYNQALREALKNIAELSWVGTPAENIATNLLADENYIDWFLTTNQRRLGESYTRATNLLNENKISFLPAQAGHYIWIDFREYVQGNRSKEHELYKEFLKNGVYVSLGDAFHAEEPGWFSLAFAVEWDALKLGIQRIIDVLARFGKE